MVFESAERKIQIGNDVVVISARGIVGVRASGDVVNRPAGISVFLDGAVFEGFPVGVLGEVHGGGRAVDEADHGVLPVTDVVAKFEGRVVEDEVSLIERVEEEVESVYGGVAFVDDDYGTTWGRA